MIRVFLALAGVLAGSSWVGVSLVDAGAFAVWPMLVGGAAFGLLLALLAPRLRLAGGGWLVVAAIGGALSMWPPIDTTLLSQDASLHRAAGLWLARTGKLEVSDAALAPLSPDQRIALFGGGSVSVRRMSIVRLPGGLVVPDLVSTEAVPSFSHLLIVWIAFAARLFGTGGVDLLGPALAALSLWAIGLSVALGVSGGGAILAGLAAQILLALLLPEHWFGRFLMTEILGQTLIWCAVAAAAIAAREDERTLGRQYAVLALGALCGACLGLAGFARLEQIWIFVPALLLARVLWPAGRRLLPPLALGFFILVGLQAAAHLSFVPTDYGNRIYRALLEVYARLAHLTIGLCRGDGYCAGHLLGQVFPLAGFVSLALGVFALRAIERRRPGQGIRGAAALLALGAFAVLYRKGITPGLPVARAVLLYVSPALVLALLLAGRRALPRSGLELALALLAIDQIVGGRVSDEQIWAARRLVPVVLPLLVMLLSRAAAERSGAGFGPLPPWRLGLVRGLLVVAALHSAWMLAPVIGRPLQFGGREFVRQLRATIPRDAVVVFSKPLDWTHLAPAIWLGEERRSLVLREADVSGHQDALLEYLRVSPPTGGVFVATGAVGTIDAPASGDEGLDAVAAWTLAKPSEVFRWRSPFLEATREHRPGRIVVRETVVRLRRVEALGAAVKPKATELDLGAR